MHAVQLNLKPMNQITFSHNQNITHSFYQVNQSLIHLNQKWELPLIKWRKSPTSSNLSATTNPVSLFLLMIPYSLTNSIICITFLDKKIVKLETNLNSITLFCWGAVLSFFNWRTCVIRQSPTMDKWTEQMQGSWWLCIRYHMCSPPHRGKGQ